MRRIVGNKKLSNREYNYIYFYFKRKSFLLLIDLIVIFIISIITGVIVYYYNMHDYFPFPVFIILVTTIIIFFKIKRYLFYKKIKIFSEDTESVKLHIDPDKIFRDIVENNNTTLCVIPHFQKLLKKYKKKLSYDNTNSFEVICKVCKINSQNKDILFILEIKNEIAITNLKKFEFKLKNTFLKICLIILSSIIFYINYDKINQKNNLVTDFKEKNALAGNYSINKLQGCISKEPSTISSFPELNEKQIDFPITVRFSDLFIGKQNNNDLYCVKKITKRLKDDFQKQIKPIEQRLELLEELSHYNYYTDKSLLFKKFKKLKNNPKFLSAVVDLDRLHNRKISIKKTSVFAMLAPYWMQDKYVISVFEWEEEYLNNKYKLILDNLNKSFKNEFFINMRNQPELSLKYPFFKFTEKIELKGRRRSRFKFFRALEKEKNLVFSTDMPAIKLVSFTAVLFSNEINKNNNPVLYVSRIDNIEKIISELIIIDKKIKELSGTIFYIQVLIAIGVIFFIYALIYNKYIVPKMNNINMSIMRKFKGDSGSWKDIKGSISIHTEKAEGKLSLIKDKRGALSKKNKK